MRIIRFALFSLTAISIAPIASAEVSFLINIDAVEDQSSADVNMVSGSWILVASTTNSTFEPIVPGGVSVGDFTSGDDLVIVRGTFNFSNGVASANPTGLSFGNGWDKDDPLALVWFPDGGTARNSVVENDAYGLYTSATGQDSSDPWITPADGELNHALKLLTDDGVGFFGSGTVPAGDVGAPLRVIPEPSVSLLGLLATLMLFRRRR